ncbi:MAG: hypothetical protein JW738_06090 [Actinobacteria bacterium]|nr:hypothetical protein [Actinomycetota bacterium]
MNKQCPKCGAVYNGRRWIPKPDNQTARNCMNEDCMKVTCPGCLRMERHQIEGIVTLRGSFFDRHRDEIWNLVNRVAKNKEKRNVNSRILDVAQNDGDTVIQTTDEHLAERMGKELQKAFKGNLEMKWQEGGALVRVIWERE